MSDAGGEAEGGVPSAFRRDCPRRCVLIQASNVAEQAEADRDGSDRFGKMRVIYPLPRVVLFGRDLENEAIQDQNAAPEHARRDTS